MDKEKQIVEITKKAVRKNEDNAGAFVDLLNQEIEELQKAKQLEEMAKIVCDACRNGEHCYCRKIPCTVAEKEVKALYEQGYRKLPENSVVITREDYEKLKKYKYKVQCGVCFTLKDWFDFINEDSKHKTSLLIEAKEQGYEQAHKEMLKDCIESNKIAEQIGYEKGSKETAENVIRKVRELLNNCETIYEDDKYLITPNVGYLMKDVDDGLDEIAKELGIEIKE